MQEIAPYIVTSSFLTEEYCDFILKACTHANTWQPFKEDTQYSTFDINFETDFPMFFDKISTLYKTTVVPNLQALWGVDVTEPYAIFAIKYWQEGQTSLKLHRDDSFISASIKLNTNYSGGELYFPEQKCSNASLNTGDIIVWPGTITHPHECLEVTEGEKYAITIWTKFPEPGYY